MARDYGMTVPGGIGAKPEPGPAPDPAPAPGPAPFVDTDRPRVDAVSQYDAAIDEVAAPAAPDASSRYDHAIDAFAGASHAALTASLHAAVETDADRAARVQALAAKEALPPSVVDRNLDLVASRSRLSAIDVRRLQESHPELSSWLANPDNAAVAHDDIPSLRGIDYAVRAINEPGSDPTGILPPGFSFGRSGEIYESLPGGLSTFVGDFAALDKRMAEIQSDTEDLRDRTPGRFMAGARGSIAATLNLFGGNQDKADQATSDLAASQYLDPGFGSSVIRGAGGIAADIPLMLAGGPLGRLVRGAGWVKRFLQVAAISQPLAIRNAATAGREHGAGAGALSWLIDSTVPAAFPIAGREAAILGIGEPLIGRGVAAAAGGLAKHAANDVVQNVATDFAHALADYGTGVDRNALDPQALAGRLAVSGTLGGLMGVAFHVPRAAAELMVRDQIQGAQASEFRNRMGVLASSVAASKLGERAPDRLAALVDHLVGAGERNVYFNQDDWDAHWTGQKVDPIRAADQFGLRDAYLRAKAHGGDMAVPIADFLARTKADAELAKQVPTLLDLVRQKPGAKNAVEAGASLKDLTDQLEQLARDGKQQGEAPAHDSAVHVGERVVEQLTTAGFDEKTAKQYGKLYEGVFRSLGSRAGKDPAALFDRYALRVQRDLPAALKAQKGVDPYSVLLDRLRSGQIPQEREIFGTSLVDFLRERGVQDQGTELSTMEADAGRKAFQRSLIRPDGLTLDHARELAIERGYLPEGASINDLLAAIREEAHGKPVYNRDNANPQQQDVRDALLEIQARLKAAGVDLATTDNETAKRALTGGADAEPMSEAAQRVLDQRVPIAEGMNLKDVEALRARAAAAARGELDQVADPNAATGRFAAITADAEQVLAQEKRGQISFGSDRRFAITLFDKADLSTFLHESGHLYLEVLGDLAQESGTDPKLGRDFQSILDWLGVKTRDEIGTPQHEQFARGFEAYLREGKAPSMGLRRAFARFRAWLVAIYRSVSDLRVDLTPEIRGVFDRLVAAEDEINAAQLASGVKPVFTSADQAGMTADEFGRYQQSVEDAKQQAEDVLVQEHMRVLRREQSRLYRLQKAKERVGVEAEVNQRREYVALSVLQKGVLPDGSPLPEGFRAFKIDRQAIVDAEWGGEPLLKRLPRPWVYSTDGGIHPDQAAEILGYRSGEELIYSLANARPKRAVIDAETDVRMRERYPDLLTDGTAGDEALKAVHSEKRGALLVEEARRLGIRAGQKPAPHEYLKVAAEETIGRQIARDVRPEMYRQAEARASRQAFESAARGDHAEAFQAKQRELLNHELFRAAAAAREMIEGTGTYLRSFDKAETRERIGKAGGWEWTVAKPDGTTQAFPSEDEARAFSQANGDAPFTRTSSYLDQIDQLLERYEVRRVTGRQLVRRQSLRQFIADQEAIGGEVDIPDEVVDQARTVNWREISVDQVEGLRDSVRSIEHLARLKNKLLRAQEKATFDEAIGRGIATVVEHSKGAKAPVLQKTGLDKNLSKIGAFFAGHRKMASLVRQMDGGVDAGPLWEMLVRPLNEAGDREAVMREAATTKLHALFKAWGKSLAKDPFTRTEIPAIGASLTRLGRIMVALNWGNAGNRQRVMEGFGWQPEQVQAVLDTLDHADLKLVQGILDHVNGYWSEIAAKQQRVTGVAPRKVEALPIEAKAGTIAGGYFPIAYDREASARAGTFDAVEQAKASMMGAAMKASTRRGHTKERAAGAAGMRLDLDVGVVFKHVETVVHDLTHHEALRDISKLLNDRRLADTIQGHYGRNVMDQLRGTLTDVAAGERGAQDALERGLGFLRSGVSIATMGWNLMSAIQQVQGFGQSISRVGVKHMGGAFARIFRDAASWTASGTWVDEKSALMRLRGKTQMRELNEIANQVGPGGLRRPVDRTFYYLMTKMQRAVDIPTWLGAYEKAMDGGHDDATAVAVADQAVLDTQGGGQIKDLAQIQRGGALKKLWTTFYHYFNTTYNMTAESIGGTRWRDPMSVAKLAMDMLLIYSFPAVVGVAIKHALRGDDNQPETWAKDIAKEHLGMLLGTVVLGRELTAGFTSDQGYGGPAGARAISALVDLEQEATAGHTGRAFAKALATVGGTLLHIPTVQVWRLIDAFAYHQRQTNPVRAALFGRPPPKR